tara:strand:- start:53757 stop:54548 length:792 start_codon:yes stop_codon:yes gene_type:complete
MNFNLVFTKSGDMIELNTHNPPLVEYYFESITKSSKNKFNISCDNLMTSLEYLGECLLEINEYFVDKFNFSHFTEFVNIRLYNQDVLNKLHMVWVKFQLQHAKINTILHKINPVLCQKFRDINQILHNIENFKFKIRNFDAKNIWSCENIFGSKITDFNRYNVNIKFNDLGRQTYEKWKHYDENINDIDTDDFTTLSGELILSITKTYKQSAPDDYVSYCKNNNLSVIGSTIGFGNFTQQIEIVQDILYRNMKTGCKELKIVV